MGTYSFADVAASIAGPGGAFPVGSGVGAAEEGITTEMIEEKDLMTLGADGQIMHSLRASNAARITIRLLKTSPVNAMLSALYNFQRQSSIYWGQNTLLVSDLVRGDIISLSQVAFGKQPNITYAKDGGLNEWLFFGSVDMLLGTGVPDVNI